MDEIKNNSFYIEGKKLHSPSASHHTNTNMLNCTLESITSNKANYIGS